MFLCVCVCVCVCVFVRVLECNIGYARVPNELLETFPADQFTRASGMESRSAARAVRCTFLQMIRIGREVGSACKFPGSGGAIVGMCNEVCVCVCVCVSQVASTTTERWSGQLQHFGRTLHLAHKRWCGDAVCLHTLLGITIIVQLDGRCVSQDLMTPLRQRFESRGFVFVRLQPFHPTDVR